jgi:hypothetical protein
MEIRDAAEEIIYQGPYKQKNSEEIFRYFESRYATLITGFIFNKGLM